MARKNIFPVILEGTQTVTSAADWDGVSGRVTLTSTGDLGLTVADYTNVPEGAVVLVHNKYGSAANTINIDPNFQGDEGSDVITLESGEMVTLCYTSEFGWFVLGHIGSARALSATNAIGGIQ